VLAATIIGSSMAFVDGTVVNIALPVLQRQFNASVLGAQWVIESYALLLAALLLPAGSLGDFFGRRRLFALGIVIFAIASAGCGLAQSIGQLIAARALQGVGAAILIPASLAILGAAFDPSRRGRAVGAWSSWTALTMSLGPVLGGWLVQHVSWRAAFYINLPLATAVLYMLYRHVPESRDPTEGRKPDWIGTALVAGGFGGLVYGLIESSHLGFGDARIVAALAGGTAALLLFLFSQFRGRTPMMPPELFRSRPFVGANVLTFLLYGALAVVFFFLPFHLLEIQGYSPTAAGAALLPFSLLVFALSRFSGALADRAGVKLPLVLGPLLAGVGMALLALPGVGGSYWATFFPGIAVLGLGMGLTAAPLTAAVLNAVEARQSGLASGVNNAVSRVAGLLAIALFGLLMLRGFSRELQERLPATPASPTETAALLAESTRLAAVPIPETMAATARDEVERAIDTSFVGAYRQVMAGNALLALLAAATASLTIPGRNAAKRVRATTVTDGVSVASGRS